jgi:ubiquinone/menaquinone biosynthesis C-methylase UbiE
MGDPYVVADNTALPFADESVDQVVTNSVPIDVDTPMGPGIQSNEVWRILKPGGQWLHNGIQVPRP